MRKALIYCLLLFLVLALFPAFAILITDNSDKITITDNKPDTKNKETNTSDQSEDIVKLALKLIDEDFCNKSIMAALAIAENNFYYNKENNIKTDESFNQAQQNEDFTNKVKKLYQKLDVKISYKKERVYIPAISLSAGNTETHEDYPYVKAVASPWDCLDEDFVYGKDYACGVSMNGIDYLCKEDMDYKDALKWYLPDFEIK